MIIGQLSQILISNKNARLFHPELGNVIWHDFGMGQGRQLYFGRGPEKNKPLVVDETVLFDETWLLIEEDD